MPVRLPVTFVCLWTALLSVVPASAERLGYPPEEFIARRKALATALGDGTVLLIGKTLPANATRFHQDNDFYYFTGNDNLNAVLILDVKAGAAHLFLPRQSEREIPCGWRELAVAR